MSDNDEVNQLIKTIKEIFINSKDDINELSKNIDKYLIPEELEKKNNAEVSTPYKLRNEMLDTIPNNFWKKPRKMLNYYCIHGNIFGYFPLEYLFNAIISPCSDTDISGIYPALYSSL